MNSYKKFGQMLSALFIIAALLIMGLALVYAENSVEPSKPFGMQYVSNSTNAYPNGTLWNLTRGYIHTINITEKQPTFKWIGFVGNVSGKYALQDSDGFALYDWTITTTTGEVYATRFTGYIPDWENMKCASAENLTVEEQVFNHSKALGASADEDSLIRTFTSNGASFDTFYVGQTASIAMGAQCYGLNLNRNDAHTGIGKNWTELVLTDQTIWNSGVVPDATSPWPQLQARTTYAVRIQNDSLGYRNDQLYDFQMILPQSGLEGVLSPGNTAYYFFVELV